MHKRFEHKDFEKKWQEKWETGKLYDVTERDDSKEKEYVLVELPYPSGNLHIGHWYAFAVPDIYVRYKRMLGKDVIYPMGFDAFGLPAENAAIKRNINPREWTESNIEYMRNQLASMGNAFTWNKTASTIDPDYYKWTQWMFTQFFENDIAYRGEGVVNWCPGCNTVIANEQVLSDDTCERSGDKIEKKKMPQWMLRITDYADALIDDLDELDWPEFIKQSQRNWIGRSEGAELSFPIKTEKKHFVIIHGKGRQSNEIWYKTLKEKLESLGHTVNAPDLPESGIPNIKNWVETIKKECTFDENTTVIAHSFGTVAALKAIESLSNSIERLVLVGGFIDPEFKDKQREHVFDWKFDFDKIISNVADRRVLHCVPDHAVSDKQAENLANALKVAITPIKVHLPHGDDPYEMSIFYHAYESINVFSTRPDTLYGATYIVLAPEHELVQQNRDTISNWNEVETYISEATQKNEQDRLDGSKEKTGVKLEGIAAINPANNEEIPVFIADYVLAGYGTGAIMAVPAHDERDNEFAKKFELPIAEVVSDSEKLINSEEFNGMNSEEAKVAITEKVGGKLTNTYRLRDWSVGRQRYWGVPIPIVYDKEGKAHPIPKEHLPWTLPEDVDFKPTGEPPLAKSAELLKRTEDIFGKGWTPEVETMDTFVDSSWYFMRYIDNQNQETFSSPAAQKDWLPVDLYFGGAEHTTMHLLYSRFWMKALHKLGLSTYSEPYKKRINRSLILGPDGNKMSKSKGNVVDPDEQVDRVGSDAVKMYLAFMGPYAEVNNYPWDLGGIAGIRRFLERVNGLEEHITDKESSESLKQLHKVIKKVGEDIVELKFNTAISAMMMFLNQAEKNGLSSDSYNSFLQILAPFAPHLTEELWSKNNSASIHSTSFPNYDDSLVKDDIVTIGVQINGKLRGDISVSPQATEEEVQKAAHENQQISSKLEGATVVKVVYVPGRILNFIIKNE